MPKVGQREIIKSVHDHAEPQASTPKRHVNRGPVSHTSTGDPRQQRPLLNRRKADPRDLYWVALGKQVGHGAAVRLTVR